MMDIQTETSGVVEEVRPRGAGEPADRGESKGREILVRTWGDLVTGRARVARVYADTSRHYVELVAGSEKPRLRDLEFLVPVLLGRPQKAVAIEANCSTSSVATAAAKCLHAMGVECHTRDVPMIIVMMAHACHQQEALRWVHVRSDVAENGSTIVSASRPETLLDDLLSPCEREVIRCRIDGLSHEHIARERNTSVRTVANQIASVSGKLQVSGRLDLFSLLLCGRGVLERSEAVRTADRAGDGVETVVASAWGAERERAGRLRKMRTGRRNAQPARLGCRNAHSADG